MIASVFPYLIGVFKGKLKPRITSWFIWCLLTGIASAAAFSEHQYPTAFLLLSSFLGTLLIVIFGWKHGDRKIDRLDIVCLIGALVGIILWAVFNSPAIAVLVTITIDLVGGIPTLVHSWKKPGEESWATFLLSFLGAAFTLFVIKDWQITAFAFPLYLVSVNMWFAMVIIIRRHILAGNKSNKKR